MQRYTTNTVILWCAGDRMAAVMAKRRLGRSFQNTEIMDKEVSLGEPSAVNVILLRQNRLLPLSTLLAVNANSPYYHEDNKGSIFYAEAWALTHYLTMKDKQDKTDRIGDYLRLVSNDVDPVTAASRPLGISRPWRTIFSTTFLKTVSIISKCRVRLRLERFNLPDTGSNAGASRRYACGFPRIR